jgi:CheY-like chemotaxis protein
MRDPQEGAVLIVNADTSERRALRGMLAPLGCRVVGADSAAAARRAVTRDRFDAIVVDARRPHLDGYETARLLRKQAGAARMPIIFVDAFGGDEHELATVAADAAVDFVFTPVLGDALRAQVSTALGAP